jgi:hypothetical protein
MRFLLMFKRGDNSITQSKTAQIVGVVTRDAKCVLLYLLITVHLNVPHNYNFLFESLI